MLPVSMRYMHHRSRNAPTPNAWGLPSTSIRAPVLAMSQWRDEADAGSGSEQRQRVAPARPFGGARREKKKEGRCVSVWVDATEKSSDVASSPHCRPTSNACRHHLLQMKAAQISVYSKSGADSGVKRQQQQQQLPHQTPRPPTAARRQAKRETVSRLAPLIRE
ncbi:hypothetical protein HPB50_008734 [Hyalomma asiaticum]|uniref:Uncharacterized protein n=1 Tax=Hyalomma asiaticum TaxID=266040 RepID=A0ACB7SFZ0_HYAAI|nr:hypothetical protein HPB50_008734 [Hyalomma asiaticum]